MPESGGADQVIGGTQGARLHRAPSVCPVCTHELITLRVGCPSCGTELSGHFSQCEFCRLDGAERAILEVFLRSRGNVKDVQANLGVSYPTARQRVAELLAQLGFADVSGMGTAGSGPQSQAREPHATPTGSAPEAFGGAYQPTAAPTGRSAQPTTRPGSTTTGNRPWSGAPADAGADAGIAQVFADVAAGVLTVAQAETLLADHYPDAN